MALGTDDLQLVPETSRDLEKLKHAITINQIIRRFTSSGVSLDHGTLVGLGDDDHPQYYNSARLTAVLADYVTDTELTTALSNYVLSSSLNESIDDRVGSLLQAGNNITLTYNDGANTLTIAVSGLTSSSISDFAEAVDDRLNALLVAGSGITGTYDDGANTYTIAVDYEAIEDRVNTLLTAGSGISKSYNDAGNALTLSVDINGLTAESSVDAAADYFMMYDASAGALRKVLGSNMPGGGGGGSASPVNDGAEVRRTTNLSLTAATWTLLAFNTETRDDGNYWSSGNSSRFTITNSGWYAISLNAFFDSSNVQCGVAIGLNGSPATSANEIAAGHFGASAAFQRAQAQTIRYLNAGDYVEAYAYASGSSTVAGATIPAVFSIHRLGIAASPGNPVNDGATITNSAAQAISNPTTLTFDTEVRDDGSYATLGTNNDRLTVTNAGWYVVTGCWQFDVKASTGWVEGFIKVNGSTVIGRNTIYGYTLESYIAPSVSAVAYLNAGDYVQLVGAHTAGGTINTVAGTARLAIHRLGTPSVAKSVDSFPNSPNTIDDEFEGPSLASKWTWRNQGSATATMEKGWLKLKAPAGTTQNTRNIEQTISGSFKIQSKMAIMSPSMTQYLNGGLALWNNSSGKGMIFCFFVDAGNVYRLMICRMNSATSFGTAPYKADIWNGIPRLFLTPQYFEIEYDGTTMYFRYSDTGLDNTWYLIHSETTATFLGGAPDRVGLFANSENSNDVYLLCDWFRRVS